MAYQPKADLMLHNRSTHQRVWIELGISRADPATNQMKFGSVHLLNPLPGRDAFVSLISRHIATGRSNLAAHATWLLRANGMRAFQMPLLPELDALTVKRLNQGEVSLDQLPTPDLMETRSDDYRSRANPALRPPVPQPPEDPQKRHFRCGGL